MSNPQSYIYKVLEWDHYDADSFNLTLDLGFNLVSHLKVRIYGIDTTELRDRRPDFKAFAYLAKRKAHDWVEMAQVRGDVFFKSENYSGKYGRPLGDLIDNEGNRLTDFLKDERLAVAYHGQNKDELEEAHRANIRHLIEKGDLDVG